MKAVVVVEKRKYVRKAESGGRRGKRGGMAGG